VRYRIYSICRPGKKKTFVGDPGIVATYPREVGRGKQGDLGGKEVKRRERRGTKTTEQNSLLKKRADDSILKKRGKEFPIKGKTNHGNGGGFH